MTTALRARVAAYGGSSRIVGVDLARGLAVLGMYGAHVGLTKDFDWAQPGTWLDVVNGRSSILFALLAGVSIAIISGGQSGLEGIELKRARVRILTRAIVIFVLGAYLASLDTGIAVILPVYAVLFVATLPFLRLPSRWLFAIAAILAVLMPLIVFVLAPGSPEDDLASYLFVTGPYPALIWIAFFLVGLAIGRLDLRATSTRLRILTAGIGLAVLGYGASALVPSGSVGDVLPADARDLSTVEAHSGTPFEVVGSTGFALAILAVCLLVPRAVRWLLYPLAAIGAMALTAYTVHVLIVDRIGSPAFAQPDNGLFLGFVAGALLVCAAWTLLLGRGPLERALTGLSRVAAQALPER
ncbi:MAG: hypothetical protein QOI70_1789 [Microbacteriaceae bacterium]|jgi:uncharacterized membrane protein YeiB|nr:hypothetical protein [Microbacteriaceae bacterium]